MNIYSFYTKISEYLSFYPKLRIHPSIACLLIAVFQFSSVSYADQQSNTTLTSRYNEVVAAFQQIVAGRTLRSEEGSEIRFESGSLKNDSNYRLKFEHVFPSGAEAVGQESVWSNGQVIYVDQVINDVIARRYVATIEGPFQVLRIKPEHEEDSNFISRDCMRAESTHGTVCYVKVRYHDDVIVSTYRETIELP